MPKEILVLPVSNAILFPHGSLSFQIKESRYGAVIRETAKDRREIGILFYRNIFRKKKLITIPKQSLIGCLGMVEMFERLPLGRLNILLRGGKRFNVQRTSQSKACYRAEVALLDDVDFRLTAAEKIRLANHLYNKLEKYLQATLKIDTLSLSYKFDKLNLERLINQAAMYLDVCFEEKQRILEISSLEKRYQFINNIIEEGLAIARFSENRMCIFENPILN